MATVIGQAVSPRFAARGPAGLAGAVTEGRRVEGLGGKRGASRFTPGDEVFGHLVIPPLGSAGTYAEYVAVTQDEALARVPAGLDLVTAVSGSLGRTRWSWLRELIPSLVNTLPG